MTTKEGVTEVPVLIVGAGPTGLVMAHELARHGVEFRIIDKHASPLELTKSAALHARTLEIFEDLGVAGRILDEGERIDHLFLRTKYQDRVHLDFTDLENTRFNHMVDIPQNRTEHILIDHLHDRGVSIDREVKLVDFQQYPDRVEATLQHEDGTQEVCRAGWLVGCDGAKSTVRNLVGLEFQGEDYTDPWVLCDARAEWPLPRNEMTFSSSEDGIYGVFPLPGENRFRLAYTQNHDKQGNPIEPTLEDAQESLRRTGIEGRVLDADQFWVFDLDHRQAEHYRKERTFLVGDAAHVHTPFGGQGMNLGVSDAYNLGWKLALVASGYAQEELLDSFEAERHPIGKRVIQTTHLGASAMLMLKGVKSYLRDGLMVAGNASAAFRHRMTYTLSQLEHNYRGTELAAGKAGGLAAGDRAPDEGFYDSFTNTYRRIFDLVRGTKHKLLLVDSDDQDPISRDSWREIAGEVLERYPKLIDVHLITTDHRLPESAPVGMKVWGDRGMDLEQYHNPGATTAYLIRPDGYIAYAHKPAQLGHLMSYLDEMPYTNGRVGSQNSPGKTFASQTPAKKEDMMTTEDRPQIITMPLRGVNAYLVRGDKGSVLVDTGFPGMEDTILDKLSKSGVSPEEISLILLTHGHPDHAGSAAALKKRLGVPVAIHAQEADWARTGLSEIPQPIRLFGRLVKAITKPEFPSFEPDILLEEGTTLKEYGLTGEILHTPGHSPGSISLLLPDGDTLVGDVMAGGFVRENKPDYPFLAEDVPLVRKSIQKLMGRAPARLYFGHGKPSGGKAARQRFADDIDLG